MRSYHFNKDNRWANGVYLKSGGGTRDILGVDGTTWTLDGDEQVNTREIAKMTTARFEMGYD